MEGIFTADRYVSLHFSLDGRKLTQAKEQADRDKERRITRDKPETACPSDPSRNEAEHTGDLLHPVFSEEMTV